MEQNTQIDFTRPENGTRPRSLSRSLSSDFRLEDIAKSFDLEDAASHSKSTFNLSHEMEDLTDKSLDSINKANNRTRYFHRRRNSTFLSRTFTPLINGTKWLPEDLAKVRDQTQKQIRPFLELLNSALMKCEEEEGIAVLHELRKIALSFLFATADELKRGTCKKYIMDLQILQKKSENASATTKELMIKLLFILSSYSRVQEYLDNVAKYMVSSFISVERN